MTKFRRLLSRFEDAAVQLALKGSKEPESWDEIETEYAEAKDALLAYVKGLKHDEAAK